MYSSNKKGTIANKNVWEGILHALSPNRSSSELMACNTNPDIR